MSKSTSSRSANRPRSNSSESISLRNDTPWSAGEAERSKGRTHPKKTISGLTRGLPSHSLGAMPSPSLSSSSSPSVHFVGDFLGGGAGGVSLAACSCFAVHTGHRGTREANTSASIADPGKRVRHVRHDAVANEPVGGRVSKVRTRFREEAWVEIGGRSLRFATHRDS